MYVYRKRAISRIALNVCFLLFIEKINVDLDHGNSRTRRVNDGLCHHFFTSLTFPTSHYTLQLDYVL